MTPALRALAAFAAVGVAVGWTAEGGDAQRTNRVELTRRSADAGARVLTYPLGRHHSPSPVAGHWGSLPVLDASNTTVLVPRSDNALVLLPAPELVGGTAAWTQSRVFTPSLLPGATQTTPQLSSPCVLGGTVFWVQRAGSLLWAASTSTGAMPAWAPLNLTTAALRSGYNASWTTKRGYPFSTFDDSRYALTCNAGSVWAPDPLHDGVLRVDAATGAPTYAGLSTSTSGRLVGGASTTYKSNTAVVFGHYGSSKGLLSLFPAVVDAPAGLPRASINCTWHAKGPYDAAKCHAAVSYEPPYLDFTHPLFLYFRAEYEPCAITWHASEVGLRVTATYTSTGGVCGGSLSTWTAAGYLLRNEFTELLSAASAPAAVPAGLVGFRLLWALRTRTGVTAAPYDCVLLSVLVDETGPYDHSVEAYRVPGVACYAAPAVVMDAWGPGAHGVALVTADGVLRLFDATGFGAAGPRYAVAGHASLPSGRSSWVAQGPYLTVTAGGSVLWVARDTTAVTKGGQDELTLVAVASAFNGPVGGGAGSGGAGGGPSAGTVAGALAASLAGVALLAAAVVYLAPHASFTNPLTGAQVVPAAAIRGAAGAAWAGATGAVAFVAGSGSNSSRRYAKFETSSSGSGAVGGDATAPLSGSASRISYSLREGGGGAPPASPASTAFGGDDDDGEA
jgi:hypothetical protein